MISEEKKKIDYLAIIKKLDKKLGGNIKNRPDYSSLVPNTNRLFFGKMNSEFAFYPDDGYMNADNVIFDIPHNFYFNFYREQNFDKLFNCKYIKEFDIYIIKGFKEKQKLLKGISIGFDNKKIYIAEKAFENCNFVRIYLGPNVVGVGKRAFYNKNRTYQHLYKIFQHVDFIDDEVFFPFPEDKIEIGDEFINPNWSKNWYDKKYASIDVDLNVKNLKIRQNSIKKYYPYDFIDLLFSDFLYASSLYAKKRVLLPIKYIRDELGNLTIDSFNNKFYDAENSYMEAFNIAYHSAQKEGDIISLGESIIDNRFYIEGKEENKFNYSLCQFYSDKNQKEGFVYLGINGESLLFETISEAEESIKAYLDDEEVPKCHIEKINNNLFILFKNNEKLVYIFKLREYSEDLNIKIVKAKKNSLPSNSETFIREGLICQKNKNGVSIFKSSKKYNFESPLVDLSNKFFDFKFVTIENNAFENAKFKGLILPNNLKEIKDYVFKNAKFNYLEIPESVETIKSSAFMNDNEYDEEDYFDEELEDLDDYDDFDIEETPRKERKNKELSFIKLPTKCHKTIDLKIPSVHSSNLFFFYSDLNSDWFPHCNERNELRYDPLTQSMYEKSFYYNHYVLVHCFNKNDIPLKINNADIKGLATDFIINYCSNNNLNKFEIPEGIISIERFDNSINVDEINLKFPSTLEHIECLEEHKSKILLLPDTIKSFYSLQGLILIKESNHAINPIEIHAEYWRVRKFGTTKQGHKYFTFLDDKDIEIACVYEFKNPNDDLIIFDYNEKVGEGIKIKQYFSPVPLTCSTVEIRNFIFDLDDEYSQIAINFPNLNKIIIASDTNVVHDIPFVAESIKSRNVKIHEVKNGVISIFESEKFSKYNLRHQEKIDSILVLPPSIRKIDYGIETCLNYKKIYVHESFNLLEYSKIKKDRIEYYKSPNTKDILKNR